ncbi:MAG: hypothetical protein H6738_24370 [Alphaproteobacteria bacterium]|nr:hypothetical protein [Alphaproteobacteria bacterium]MCB9699945.1 hypothetical protein [Alphaproteobacteria bacterium]
MLLAALLACGPRIGEFPSRPACDAPAGDVCAVMGTGELGFNGEDLPLLETRLASPTAVLTDADDRPMVVDYSNMLVRVAADDGTAVTVVGSGEHAYSEIGAPALETPLENPVDAAWGPDGLLYLLPQHEGRVIRVGAGGTIELCAGSGILADHADDVPALEAEMGYGGGLAIGEDGTLFVSDNTFSKVRRFDPDGTASTILGTDHIGMGGPGYGPETSIWSPERITLDEERGRLLVADTLNHRVLSVDLETLRTEVVAGTGERGYEGDGGDALAATFDQPVGLAVAPDGTILVADLENDAIRAVWPDGTVDTVLGGLGDADPVRFAQPLDFPIRGPAGMAFMATGDLLIAERSGQRVLRWFRAADAL